MHGFTLNCLEVDNLEAMERHTQVISASDGVVSDIETL